MREAHGREVTRRSALGFCLLGLGIAFPAASQTLPEGVDGVLRRGRKRAALAWSRTSIEALFAALDDAERHGLNGKPLSAEIKSASTPQAVQEAATQSALSLADALAHGLVDPATVNDVYTLRSNRIDVQAGLDAALRRGDLRAWFGSLAPGDAEYRALSDAYMKYRSEISSSPPANIAGGALIRTGDSDERLPAIRLALTRKGYLGPAGNVELGAARNYSADVVAAVRMLQDEEGLKVDGVIGSDTLWALNAGPADRARQIAINLERWRWLARDPSPTRIDVNTAAASMIYLRNGAPVTERRTVVGRLDWATPSLGASFDRIVINPPWYVPQSIARREILPRGAAYRARRNMYVSRGRVIQRPGPNAALGLVKFDMRNPHAIYLHDTPSKTLFGEPERHRSHGCIRVDGAVDFARLLANERGKSEDFDRLLAAGRTATLKFDEAIEVRLLYRTAYMRGGRIAFAPDPYGRDARLAAALGMPERKRPSPVRFSQIPFGP